MIIRADVDIQINIEINSRRSAGLFEAAHQDSDSVIAARSAFALDFR